VKSVRVRATVGEGKDVKFILTGRGCWVALVKGVCRSVAFT
jgi:hypothetical protein